MQYRSCATFKFLCLSTCTTSTIRYGIFVCIWWVMCGVEKLGKLKGILLFENQAKCCGDHVQHSHLHVQVFVQLQQSRLQSLYVQVLVMCWVQKLGKVKNIFCMKISQSALKIIRNIYIFVSKYLYNLNNKVWNLCIWLVIFRVEKLGILKKFYCVWKSTIVLWRSCTTFTSLCLSICTTSTIRHGIFVCICD